MSPSELKKEKERRIRTQAMRRMCRELSAEFRHLPSVFKHNLIATLKRGAVMIVLVTSVRADTLSTTLCNYVSQIVNVEMSLDSADAADVFLVPYYLELDSVARARNIPISLLAAFIQEESLWDAYAYRTEPHYLKKKKVIAEARAWSRRYKGSPSFQSELWARSTSFGLMQPMGQVAREQRFDKRYLTELIRPFNSIDEGAKHLLSKLKRYPGDTLSAISAYNQGNNRMKDGMYENYKYVYRVRVAWLAYQKIFQQFKAYNEQIEQFYTMVSHIAGSDLPLRNAHTKVIARERIVGDASAYLKYLGDSASRLRQSRYHDSAAFYLDQSSGEPSSGVLISTERYGARIFFAACAVIAGLVFLFGLGRLFFARHVASISGYGEHLFHAGDEAIRSHDRNISAKNDAGHSIHGIR
jgi:hypothetical protein